uniref:Uncharacterized protein n=1 Tax=Strombidium rassoulzadegani TaxID=1082188 RepID=A0A7S3CH38_9SPIT|mmetsp:Transcript_1001/g.1799  ORF Transcript_1001/g.1799 Transcript_1001/m.1799 type:complete len:137 (+) Transcript_1001:314-724(+)|eukprot:CAMPEP_0168618780 /NCGR_PEP_ID=MMETSP0449_2-20121227/6252_1 /TAXON_ID=1082188 /ORGANISM="Strombidium rassoulzadegani, Strain ras09" /LENGTH=136 /DNA_ID=CAMNT_0008659673 /DNA_START=209 /DNA_END=619 /DNA_ORIENTATION=+
MKEGMQLLCFLTIFALFQETTNLIFTGLKGLTIMSFTLVEAMVMIRFLLDDSHSSRKGLQFAFFVDILKQAYMIWVSLTTKQLEEEKAVGGGKEDFAQLSLKYFTYGYIVLDVYFLMQARRFAKAYSKDIFVSGFF